MYLLNEPLTQAPVASVGFVRRGARAVSNVWNVLAGQRILGLCLVFLGIGMLFTAFTVVCSAQTDITSAVSAMSTLWDAIELIAVGVIVFVVGRKLFRKI